jgi:hypothetical protein
MFVSTLAPNKGRREKLARPGNPYLNAAGLATALSSGAAHSSTGERDCEIRFDAHRWSKSGS